VASPIIGPASFRAAWARIKNAATRKNLGRAAFANGRREVRPAQSEDWVMIADGWNSDPMLLGNAGRGQWTCKRASFGRGRREDYITKMTSVAPLDEPCPRWLQFLNEATGNDAGPDQIPSTVVRIWSDGGGRASTRWCSSTGRAGMARAVFLNVGPGHHEGTTRSRRRWTRSRLPARTSIRPTLRCFAARGWSPPPKTEEGRAWAEARIKQMTGGDRVNRALHAAGTTFSFTPQFKTDHRRKSQAGTA